MRPVLVLLRSRGRIEGVSRIDHSWDRFVSRRPCVQTDATHIRFYIYGRPDSYRSWYFRRPSLRRGSSYIGEPSWRPSLAENWKRLRPKWQSLLVPRARADRQENKPDSPFVRNGPRCCHPGARIPAKLHTDVWRSSRSVYPRVPYTT